MRLSSLVALTIAAAGPYAVDSILPPSEPEPERARKNAKRLA